MNNTFFYRAIGATVDVTGITYEQMMSDDKAKDITFARDCCMTILREQTAWSLEMIGGKFNITPGSASLAVTRAGWREKSYVGDGEAMSQIRAILESRVITPPSALVGNGRGVPSNINGTLI